MQLLLIVLNREKDGYYSQQRVICASIVRIKMEVSYDLARSILDIVSFITAQMPQHEDMFDLSECPSPEGITVDRRS